jgi:hypothetical protein
MLNKFWLLSGLFIGLVGKRLVRVRKRATALGKTVTR